MKIMQLPTTILPITEIPVPNKKVRLFIKREDLVHPAISGNKYWKLFYNFKNYIQNQPKNPKIITFGGAFSNHIAAVAALGKIFKIQTLGIIRGEELSDKFKENPTLLSAHENGMAFRFVARNHYREKSQITSQLTLEFPNALIIPEGGSNEQAVEGIQHMLDDRTKDFHYLCTAVGTGGTVAGLSKFAEKNQQIYGYKVVNDASLENQIKSWSNIENFTLFDAIFGGYGKISDELIRFINQFYEQYQIPLDPIYTGKMMMTIFSQIEHGFFPENSKILAVHTGGLQGIKGVNQKLAKQNRPLIDINFPNFKLKK